MEIGHRSYPFPWTHGIFRDCLRADYPAWILHEDGRILGYGVLSVAADESHVLNICIDPRLQGQGLGRRLLRALIKLAGGHGARRVLLEVRPSNPHAIALYNDEGFHDTGRRPSSYPAHVGRADAIVMAKELLNPSAGAQPRRLSCAESR